MNYSDCMNHVDVLREKIGRLRVEIAQIQEMNNEYRIQGRKTKQPKSLTATGMNGNSLFHSARSWQIKWGQRPSGFLLRAFFEHDAPHLPSASSIHPGVVSEKALA